MRVSFRRPAALLAATGSQQLHLSLVSCSSTKTRTATPRTLHTPNRHLLYSTTTPSLPLSLTHPKRPQPPSLSSPSPPSPALFPTSFPSPLHPSRPSSSSSRWKLRQTTDPYTHLARVQGLKSRAAFKLLELDAKYHLFKRHRGQVVVDLGFAPGSWSQVAADRTAPDGVVVGIDIIPAQPPKGVSAIQGNFLCKGVQESVKRFLVETERRRREEREERRRKAREEGGSTAEGEEVEQILERPSYIDLERRAAKAAVESEAVVETVVAEGEEKKNGEEERQGEEGMEGEGEKGRKGGVDGEQEGGEQHDQQQQQQHHHHHEQPNLRLVDVVLSDMSAPWPQTHGFSVNTLSNPYIRLMNTSGIAFRDHAGSMDLCHAALSFASDTLKPGGHFVCKFYQGAEDKALENLLKKMFTRVYREKPGSSRSESREAFFVALKRKGDVTLQDIEPTHHE